MEQPAGPDGPGGTGTGTVNGQTGSAASTSDHASLRYTISLRSPQCTITPFPTLGVSEATSGKGQESSRFLMIHQSNRLCRWALEQRRRIRVHIATLDAARMHCGEPATEGEGVLDVREVGSSLHIDGDALLEHVQPPARQGISDVRVL